MATSGVYAISSPHEEEEPGILNQELGGATATSVQGNEAKRKEGVEERTNEQRIAACEQKPEELLERLRCPPWNMAVAREGLLEERRISDNLKRLEVRRKRKERKYRKRAEAAQNGGHKTGRMLATGQSTKCNSLSTTRSSQPTARSSQQIEEIKDFNSLTASLSNIFAYLHLQAATRGRHGSAGSNCDEGNTI